MGEKENLFGKKLVPALIFVLIAALTVAAVLSQGGGLGLSGFAEYIASSSPVWLCAALACMAGYIFFEGEAILCLCRAFGCEIGAGRGVLYSAADIYFSAITPSATGGQPACAYFMLADGIPAGVTTVVLLANLCMYTLSIVLLGAAAAVFAPSVFLSFGTLSKVLTVAGAAVQCALIAFMAALLRKRSLLHGLCHGALGLLRRLRLLRREELWRGRIDGYIEEYARHAAALRGKGAALGKALALNIAQRACIISVPALVFLAGGGNAAMTWRVWAVQCFTVLGSSPVPIPGSMGVSDYILLDGFSALACGQDAVSLELLSRTISFYGCVLVCLLVTLGGLLVQRRRNR